MEGNDYVPPQCRIRPAQQICQWKKKIANHVASTFEYIWKRCCMPHFELNTWWTFFKCFSSPVNYSLCVCIKGNLMLFIKLAMLLFNKNITWSTQYLHLHQSKTVTDPVTHTLSSNRYVGVVKPVKTDTVSWRCYMKWWRVWFCFIWFYHTNLFDKEELMPSLMLSLHK